MQTFPSDNTDLYKFTQEYTDPQPLFQNLTFISPFISNPTQQNFISQSKNNTMFPEVLKTQPEIIITDYQLPQQNILLKESNLFIACDLCQNTIAKPFTLLPCLHNVCQYHFPLFQCPSCSVNITQALPNLVLEDKINKQIVSSFSHTSHSSKPFQCQVCPWRSGHKILVKKHETKVHSIIHSFQRKGNKGNPGNKGKKKD